VLVLETSFYQNTRGVAGKIMPLLSKFWFERHKLMVMDWPYVDHILNVKWKKVSYSVYRRHVDVVRAPVNINLLLSKQYHITIQAVIDTLFL
jgi:hypothetical protein